MEAIFSTRDPVYREEEESFSAWWSKTPLGKRKQKFTEMELDAKEKAKSGKDKKGKKKSNKQ